MNYFYIILIIIILLIIYLCMVNNREHYDNYLYPIKGLEPICEEEELLPSYMPKACYLNGKLNSYANCKCEDTEGNCKICYPTIKKDSTNSNVVYNANTGF